MVSLLFFSNFDDKSGFEVADVKTSLPLDSLVSLALSERCAEGEAGADNLLKGLNVEG